jgi:hypothetical protein
MGGKSMRLETVKWVRPETGLGDTEDPEGAAPPEGGGTVIPFKPRN